MTTSPNWLTIDSLCSITAFDFVDKKKQTKMIYFKIDCFLDNYLLCFNFRSIS